MKELYTSPEAEVIVFDTKDVITTSPIGTGAVANDPTDDGNWSDWY